MKKAQKVLKKTKVPTNTTPNGGQEFLDAVWKESWTYIRTVVDVLREPILILDKDLRVMAANESFYETFHVDPKETEEQVVYQLGNGQWNIPALRSLLEDILPHNTFFKGFEVTHTFPTIGRKVIILNARKIQRKDDGTKSFPPIILLAMEDVSEMVEVAEMLARHTNQFEANMAKRAERLETDLKKLEKELNTLKENGKS